MDDVGKKLRQFFEIENFTQKEIAERMGVPTTYINAVLAGRKKLGKNNALKMHNLFGLSQAWLLTGEGEMFANSKEGQSKKGGIPIYRDARFGCSPSGFVGAIEERTADDYILVPGLKNDGRTFVVVARGESMVNKAIPSQSIPNGAFVAIEKSTLSSPQWGETYALSTDDGCIIKRLYPSEQEGCVKCVSFNETEFPCFELHTSEIHDIGIVKAVMTVNIWK